MGYQLTKLSWWHESIIDWMLIHPDRRLKDCARDFDVTPEWMYTVTNSDVFKERLAERSEAHRTAISVGVVEKASALADMALDVAMERFQHEHSAGDINLSKAVGVADKAFELAGIGGKNKAAQAPTFIQNNNVMQVESAHLQAARQRLLDRQAELREASPLTLEAQAELVE